MERINSKTKFSHYTTLNNARKIVADRTFYLSRLDKMNDISEKELHSDDFKKIFVLSLCHTSVENLPMLYLYGGIDGNGCALKMTDTQINRIIEEGIVYPVNKNNIRLQKSYNRSEYDISYSWVLYKKSSREMMYRGRYRRGREKKKILDISGIEFSTKEFCWNYEREFRVIVKFNKDIDREKIAIVFPSSKGKSGISIICGPETKEKMVSEVKEEFQEYGITNVKPFKDTKVEMRLVEKNKSILSEKH